MKWTVKGCFVEEIHSEKCWCGIIVSPDGEECNRYGEITKANCQYIVDAMNQEPGAEFNVNETHPIPWHVEEYPEHGRYAIVTTAGLGIDSLEHCIATSGGFTGEYGRKFAEVVNSFYRSLTP